MVTAEKVLAIADPLGAAALARAGQAIIFAFALVAEGSDRLHFALQPADFFHATTALVAAISLATGVGLRPQCPQSDQAHD
jgi:hypothetical protein